MTPVNYLEGNKTITNNILLKNKRILQHNFNLLQFHLETNRLLVGESFTNRLNVQPDWIPKSKQFLILVVPKLHYQYSYVYQVLARRFEHHHFYLDVFS